MNERKNNSIVVFLTLIFPFAGLIYTLSHWREKWAKNTFWLVCIYIGAVFIYWPEGTILGTGADGGRYALQLIDMYNDASISISSILSDFQDQQNQRTMDLYQPLMTYLISRFTDNGHVLFAVYALVFGFFYSRNIWYILEKLPNKRLGNLFILVSLYFLICPITEINGVRMWTALHVFVYGMMPYVLERDKSKLWLVLLTPLVHFSYWYVAIFALVFFLLPYRIKTNGGVLLYVAFALFVVSLFINTLNLNAVGGILEEYSPESYEQRIGGYLDEDYAQARTEASALNNWYVAASGNIIHWCYSLLLIVMLPCIKRNFAQDNRILHLYVFILLFSSFANIMALIPSGGRFQLVSQMFKVPLILIIAMNVPSGDRFKRYVSIACVFLMLPLIFQVRRLFELISITAIFGNFITVFFWENNVPLITIIKRII